MKICGLAVPLGYLQTELLSFSQLPSLAGETQTQSCHRVPDLLGGFFVLSEGRPCCEDAEMRVCLDLPST